jgi:hypothetical protein
LNWKRYSETNRIGIKIAGTVEETRLTYRGPYGSAHKKALLVERILRRALSF